jgi:NAD(P)H-dependent FMN reductase
MPRKEERLKMMRLVGISGSLRQQSSNTALLRAAAARVPAGAALEIYTSLGDLPHFHPDRVGHEPPDVRALEKRIQECDGVLFSTPEYAHGVPGALKDALDWLVGGIAFQDKPFALFNASPRSAYAQASLTETVKTMGGRLVPEAELTLPLLGRKSDAAAIAANPEWAQAVSAALAAFIRAIEAGRPAAPSRAAT